MCGRRGDNPMTKSVRVRRILVSGIVEGFRGWLGQIGKGKHLGEVLLNAVAGGKWRASFDKSVLWGFSGCVIGLRGFGGTSVGSCECRMKVFQAVGSFGLVRFGVDIAFLVERAVAGVVRVVAAVVVVV